MENNKRLGFIIYILVTIVSLLVLILQPRPGVSIPIFILLQALMVVLLLPNKMGALVYIPIFLLSLHYFISASYTWWFTNILVILSLLSSMILLITDNLKIKDSLFGFLKNTFVNIFRPFNNLVEPFKWKEKNNSDKKYIFKKVLLGVLIAIPFLILILLLLSQADMIFAKSIGVILKNIGTLISFNTYFKVLVSIILSLYLFGVIYLSYNINTVKNDKVIKEKIVKERDPLTLNIVMSLILVVYTIFIVIQITYLFAKGSLPYGLSYAEYAREGFFQLLFLTGFNIGLIIFNVWYNKNSNNKGAVFNKISLYYLCTINIMLLISSFYRMLLYSNDFGLTRLRLYVFGFLLFELIGLIITYFYIRKPKFNIVFIYTLFALSYYVILNIVPCDRIIAMNLVDRYEKDINFNIDYVMDLSLDAAPFVEKLINDDKYDLKARDFFKYKLDFRVKSDKWQSYNISVEEANKIWDKYKDKNFSVID